MNSIIQRVPLNDYLTAKSNWPKRLLGWEDFQLDRTPKAAFKEYDEGRYGILEAWDGMSPEDVKLKEFENLGMLPDAPHFFSIGDEIFVAPLRIARPIWYSILLDPIKRHAKGNICELGCGYGYNLGMLKAAGYSNVYGGDFSLHAGELGRQLGFDVQPFNYYEADDYKLIKENSTVVTVHSLEQLPSAAAFIENTSKIRERVNVFVHIEPCFLPERASFLGMIRNRYNQLIDHNHDLVGLLRSRKDVEIVEFSADVFGLHPLNSSNIIVWKYKE